MFRNCGDHVEPLTSIQQLKYISLLYVLCMAFHLLWVIVNSTIANDQLPLGLITELPKHGTGIITELRVQNPDHDRDVRAFFCNYLEALKICHGHFYSCGSLRSAKCIWVSYALSIAFHLSRVIKNSLHDQPPVGLIAQLVELSTNITNSLNDRLPVGLIAQLVEHGTHITNSLHDQDPVWLTT